MLSCNAVMACTKLTVACHACSSRPQIMLMTCMPRDTLATSWREAPSLRAHSTGSFPS